jgi:hypothetical protein
MTVRIDDAKFHADGISSTSDELEVIATNGGLRVIVDEPFAGDSETGFGRKCEISVDMETARALRDFLNLWITG